jgi:TatD DNase family protein
VQAAGQAAGQARLFAAVGIHPNDLQHLTEQNVAELRHLLSLPGVIAVGEIGLDYYWNTRPREAQQAGFRQQLEIAQSAQRPVIIHCRDAYDDTLEILAEYPTLRVLLHAFSGNGGHAERALAQGYLLGIAGPVTFKKSESLREIVQAAPLEQLVLETDAPYLTPLPHRGRRNEPAYLRLTAERVAKLRGLSIEELAHTTTANAARFFGLTL